MSYYNTDVQAGLLFQIQNGSLQITNQIIKDMIKDHASEVARLQVNHKRYTIADLGVPIFEKEPPAGAFEKINNQLNHDYPGLLVRTKAGYFAGIPPTMSYIPGDKTEEQIKEDSTFINAWLREITFPDLVNETALLAGNYGYTIWFVYLDKEGIPRVITVPDWEVIIVNDRTTGEGQLALRYYDIVVHADDKVIDTRTRAEWWTEKAVYFYITDGEGNFEPDETQSPNPHPFGRVPFIRVDNNSNYMSDYESVKSLVDGQDQVGSSLCNDIEQIASNFLKYKNMSIDQEAIDKMKWSGGFELDQDQDVTFLIKSIVYQPHIEFMKTNDKHIHKLSGIPDLTSEGFGNAPVISVKIKLFALESLSTIAENKMRKALHILFKMVTKVWSIAGTEINASDIQWIFQRKFPLNEAEEANTQSVMKGLVSEETRLNNYSIVGDPKAEIEKMQEEADNMIDLDNLDADNDKIKNIDDMVV